VGEWVSEKDRLHKLKELAVQTQSVVVLKGTYTVIAEPAGTLFFNITGSASLATAGAGDMLSGMIGAFLVQGYSPLESAMRGVYYHGKAGSRFMGAPVRVGEIINAIQF
jgi:NAD(P)H-hydrate epimerase